MADSYLSRSPPQAPRCSMQPRATLACTPHKKQLDVRILFHVIESEWQPVHQIVPKRHPPNAIGNVKSFLPGANRNAKSFVQSILRISLTSYHRFMSTSVYTFLDLCVKPVPEKIVVARAGDVADGRTSTGRQHKHREAMIATQKYRGPAEQTGGPQDRAVHFQVVAQRITKRDATQHTSGHATRIFCSCISIAEARQVAVKQLTVVRYTETNTFLTMSCVRSPPRLVTKPTPQASRSSRPRYGSYFTALSLSLTILRPEAAAGRVAARPSAERGPFRRAGVYAPGAKAEASGNAADRTSTQRRIPSTHARRG